MRKLKFIIPAAQVVLCIIAFNWYRFLHTETLLHQYAFPVRDIVMKANYPLMLLWSPIIYGLERAFSVPYYQLTLTIAAVVWGFALYASVGVFWYFVLLEIEKRRHGRSLIRFSRTLPELVKAALFFVAGIAATAYAYWDGRRLLILGQNNNLPTSSMVNAVVGGACLLGWTIVLITIAVKDCQLVFGSRPRPQS